ncbi:MAG TPA: tetratricopeptide repeat protein [Burkholderiales bacterium]
MRAIWASRAFIGVLAVMLTTAAAPVFPAPPRSHEEALQALASADPQKRAEAIVWLANLGTMADAPLLEARLRDENRAVRSYAEQGLWLLWSRSGDERVDALMALGAQAMQAGRHAEAIALFSEVIARKPGFAEGWNKRATAYFLAGEYEKSIADCDEVLKRNPHHFGALSGLGQIHVALGRYAEALAWFRRALEVNPNLAGVASEIERIEALLAAKRGIEI